MSKRLWPVIAEYWTRSSSGISDSTAFIKADLPAAEDDCTWEEITEDFGRECFDGRLELWDHAGNVLEAMQGAAAVLELDGRLADPGPP